MTSGGKLEVATHKLGSIHIEDKLKEETPWWAKLKKKHGGTATKDKEGSTEEPVYSTFGWVEDEDVSQTLTTQIILINGVFDAPFQLNHLSKGKLLEARLFNKRT